MSNLKDKSIASGIRVESARRCSPAPGQHPLEMQARAMEPGPGIGGNHGPARIGIADIPKTVTMSDRMLAAVTRASDRFEADRVKVPPDHLPLDQRKRIADDYRRYAADLDGAKN